jgi:hypothetical protein
LKEDYDGAEPAASSVSALNLLTLAHLVGGDTWAAQIEQVLASVGARTGHAGRATPLMLAALSSYHAGSQQLVIVGDAGAADTDALQHVARRRYRPSMILIPLRPAHRHALSARLPWLRSLEMREGRATAYLCRGFTCEFPVTSAEELERKMDGR